MKTKKTKKPTLKTKLQKKAEKMQKIEDAAMATAPKSVSVRDAADRSGIAVFPWYSRTFGKTGARRVSVDAWFNDGYDNETVGVEINDPAKIRELAAGLIAAAEWLEETV